MDEQAAPAHADRLGRLLQAVFAKGANGRRARQRVAATVGLILLFFALVAALGLYAVALSGLAVVIGSSLIVVAVAVVRPRRASLVFRGRTTLATVRVSSARVFALCRPAVGRFARALSSVARCLWEQLPDRRRAFAWPQFVVARLSFLAGIALRAVREAAADVRVVDALEDATARVRQSVRTLPRADTLKALRTQGRPSSEGALAREAFRLNADGARLRRAGAFAEAADRHRRALDVFDELGDLRAAALTKNNLALALSRDRDDVALELFEEAATTLGALGDEQSEGQVIANLAVVLRRCGQTDRAEDALDRALDKLEEHSPQYHQVVSLRRAS